MDTNDNPHGVKAGQVWQDNNRRSIDRAGNHATVTIDDLVFDGVKHYALGVRSHSGRKTRILLSQFTPLRFTKLSD